MKITSIKGKGIYLAGDNIDTDQIIPARFMKCVTFEQLGKYAFHDLDFGPCREVEILLTGKNFGCGSSREHAPQAIQRCGIKAIIAESFAEIFFGNSTKLGIPCLALNAADIKQLINAPELTIDLLRQMIICEKGEFTFTIKESALASLVTGTFDPLTTLLEAKEDIEQRLIKLGLI